MKKSVYLISAILFLLLTGFSKTPIAKGETYCGLGSFVIEKSKQPLISDARVLRTYEVTYENSSLKVRVGIDDSNRKCKNYIVVAGDFAIQYNCNGNVFGVGTVEERYVEDGIPSTDTRLNRAEYFRQKVLTQIPKDEVEHVKLISVFFPRLIAEDNLYANK